MGSQVISAYPVGVEVETVSTGEKANIIGTCRGRRGRGRR